MFDDVSYVVDLSGSNDWHYGYWFCPHKYVSGAAGLNGLHTTETMLICQLDLQLGLELEMG